MRSAAGMRAYLAGLGADPNDNSVANANVGMVVYGAPFQVAADLLAQETGQAQRVVQDVIEQQVSVQRTSGAVWALVGAGIASLIGLAFYFGRNASPKKNPRELIDELAEDAKVECLRCGGVSVRSLAPVEDNDDYVTEDECPRCGSTDVRVIRWTSEEGGR